jgi:hypothetical protein
MPLLLEDYHDLLVYRPLTIYFNSINHDAEKLKKYQDFLMRMGTYEWTLGFGNICTAEDYNPPYDLPNLQYYEREIIAAHVLIDLGKPLKFIPLLETYEQSDSL